MISKRALLALAAGSVALLASPPGWAVAVKKSGAEAKKAAVTSESSVASTSDDAAIRGQLSALAAAASSADAEKMASLFSIDGSYVDEDGARTQGRQAIQRRFSQAWSGAGKTVLALNPESVKRIGQDAAYVEGTTARKTALGMEPAARYVMLMQKQNGIWLIASATETPIVSKTASDHLKALDWIIGNWVAEQGTAKVKMAAEWAGNKSFIQCKFVVDRPGEAERIDNQIIGWDPTRQQIVSWHFNSSGGFGYGNWSKRGKEWLVDSQAVDPTGSHSNATNIISLQEPNRFSWQSVGRSVEGMSVPDTEPLTVQRVESR